MKYNKDKKDYSRSVKKTYQLKPCKSFMVSDFSAITIFSRVFVPRKSSKLLIKIGPTKIIKIKYFRKFRLSRFFKSLVFNQLFKKSFFTHSPLSSSKSQFFCKNYHNNKPKAIKSHMHLSWNWWILLLSLNEKIFILYIFYLDYVLLIIIFQGLAFKWLNIIVKLKILNYNTLHWPSWFILIWYFACLWSDRADQISVYLPSICDYQLTFYSNIPA